MHNLMPTKLKTLSIITLLVFIPTAISASAGGGNNCQNGIWTDDYQTASISEIGLQRTKRECEISKVNPKIARVAEDNAKRKIKLQEVANRLVNSLKSSKNFDIQVTEVYELGEFGKEVGLDLNPTPSPDVPMTVKYDKDKIAKIDLDKINSEAEQSKLDLQRLIKEAESMEKQFEDNAKAVDAKYDMNEMYRSESPWYLPITDFFNNIFSSISKIFSPK
jgi:hypothetical protein